MTFIRGDALTDHRGTIRFVNGFDFAGIRRFYSITHPDTRTIRAWQGHRLERKCLYVTKGAFLVACIEIDDWQHPSPDLAVQTAILTEETSEILMIPAGYANGLRATRPDSSVIVFSDMTLEAARSDDYRWDLEYFAGHAALCANAATLVE